MNRLWHFSMKQALGGSGVPADRLLRCLNVAREFLDSNTPATVLEELLVDEYNRHAVTKATCGPLHVGFVFFGGGIDRSTLCDLATVAGFDGSQGFVASTVVARELALRTGKNEVPTCLFHADSGKHEDEVATHVGLYLDEPALLESARHALAREGFHVPTFMGDDGIPNRERDITAIYFDRVCDGRCTRIEILRKGTCPSQDTL
jgi:hypothetical protein